MSAESASHEAHADEQRRAWAELSPLDRLRWLQQAKEFARRYLGAAAARPASRTSST